MKKVLSLLTTIFFIISMFNSIYAATSGNISINTSSSTIKAGQEITLTVSATDSDKLNSIEYTGVSVTDANNLTTSNLEVSKVEAANSNWSKLEEGSSIIYMYTGSAIESSDVLIITLKAKENISAGNYKVNVEGLKVYNATHAEGTDEEKITNVGTKSVQISAIVDETTIDSGKETPVDEKIDTPTDEKIETVEDTSKDITTPSSKKSSADSDESTSGKSSSKKTLPQTGVEVVSIVGIAVLSIVSIISYVSYRKYKNI